jgi:hypothetical protein
LLLGAFLFVFWRALATARTPLQGSFSVVSLQRGQPDSGELTSFRKEFARQK